MTGKMADQTIIFQEVLMVKSDNFPYLWEGIKSINVEILIKNLCLPCVRNLTPCYVCFYQM